MRKMLKAIALVFAVAAMLACGAVAPIAGPVQGVSTIVAETLAAVTSAAQNSVDTPAVYAGTTVSFPGGTFVIPSGVASSIAAETVPAVVGQQDSPWWELAPEHVRIGLQEYALQGKFHEAKIFVFPAVEYGAMNESAAANIQTLQGIAADPSAIPDSQSLPHITFFNAGPVFQSQVAVVPFQGGQGIRALTEYAQYAAPINNTDLFYHFEGLTSDGKKYVVAILPVTAPALQADSAQSSSPPAGGVPFPDLGTADPVAFENYYNSVSNLLNSAPAGDFTPSLTALDALIGSLSLAP